MRDRRIHTIKHSETMHYHVVVDGSESFDTFSPLRTAIPEDGSVRFSRRKFVGAKRTEFAEIEFCGYMVFEGEVNSYYAIACSEKTRKILGLSPRTKKFVLWYKNA